MRTSNERKALIKVGYACNNRCVFCHSDATRGLGAAPTAALLAKVTAARLQGFEMAVFSGGEPTIRHDLAALVRRVRDEGLALGFVTNGRRFAYAPFVEGMRRAGLRYVYMSLHAPDAPRHDRLVGAPAHAEALAAIRHLAAAPEVALTVNAVVTRWNADGLEALVDALLAIGNLRIKMSYLEPKGAALARLDELLMPPEEAAALIRAAIEHGRSRAAAAGAELAWDALPPCLMPGLEDLYDDLLTNRIEVMSEAFETAFFPVDHQNKGHAARCADCALRATCPGLYHGALLRYGEACLAPIARREPDTG